MSCGTYYEPLYPQTTTALTHIERQALRPVGNNKFGELYQYGLFMEQTYVDTRPR